MAHALNYNEQRGTHSLYSLKDIPWHGLGQIVAESVDPNEALKLANLDYTVDIARMKASFIPDNIRYTSKQEDGSILIGYTETINKIEYNKEIIVPYLDTIVPDIYCTYRTDNYNIFGTVGSRYEIVQNDQALDFIYNVIKDHNDMTKDNIVIQTAGALNKGERIFVTAKLPSTAIKVDGLDDQYDRYIVFTSSHDGTTPVQAMFTNIRVVCNNTLNAALHSNSNMFSFRHTRNVEKYMMEGAIMMNKALGYNNELQQTLERTLNVQMDDKEIYSFVGNVVLNNKEQIDHFIDCGTNKISINPEIISTRKLNTMNDIIYNIREGVGQDVGNGTLYSYYNGITTYIGNFVKYDDSLNKFNSIMTVNGLGYKLASAALKEVEHRLAI